MYLYVYVYRYTYMYIYIYTYKLVYIYVFTCIYNIYIVFTTEGFSEVAIESWPEWNLSP